MTRDDFEGPDNRIAAAYLLPNGMVMVFDEGGQALSEYQGSLEEVEPRLRSVSSVSIQEATWSELATL